MLDEVEKSQSAGNCVISIKGLSANVQKPMSLFLAITKDHYTLQSREIWLEPQITRYIINQTFDFPVRLKKNLVSGVYTEEKVNFLHPRCELRTLTRLT
jgi:hypothetical protein